MHTRVIAALAGLTALILAVSTYAVENIVFYDTDTFELIVYGTNGVPSTNSVFGSNSVVIATEDTTFSGYNNFSSSNNFAGAVSFDNYVTFDDHNTITVEVGADLNQYYDLASSGDTLVLGAGTYTMTTNFLIDTSKVVHLRGQGVDATRIKFTGADGTAGGITVYYAQNTVFSDFTIEMATNGAALNYYGNFGNALTNNKVRNVNIEYTVDYGDQIGINLNDANIDIEQSRIRCYSTNNYVAGIYQAGWATTDKPLVNWVRDCDFEAKGETTWVKGVVLAQYGSGPPAGTDIDSYIYNNKIVALSPDGGTTADALQNGNGGGGSSTNTMYAGDNILDGDTYDIVNTGGCVFNNEGNRKINQTWSNTGTWNATHREWGLGDVYYSQTTHPAAIASHAQVYCVSNELYAMDSTGQVSVLSPHPDWAGGEAVITIEASVYSDTLTYIRKADLVGVMTGAIEPNPSLVKTIPTPANMRRNRAEDMTRQNTPDNRPVLPEIVVPELPASAYANTNAVPNNGPHN